MKILPRHVREERHEKLMDYLIDLADYINQVIATLRCDICGLKKRKGS